MNSNQDDIFNVLREIPAEVTMEQVGNMVAAFPLAAAGGSWLSSFNLNSILMTTAGTLLVASSIYVITATEPATATFTTPTVVEIAPEDAVVWTPPKEQPVVKLEPIPVALAARIPATREPLTAPVPEPIAEAKLEPELIPEPTKAKVWVRDESRQFDVTGFTSVKVLGSADVKIEQGPFHVQVDGNPDLADLFSIEVVKDVLTISLRKATGELRKRSCNDVAMLTVQMPSLERIELFGSGSVHTNDFKVSGDLELNLKGSGDIHLGTVTGLSALKVLLAGSGDVVTENVEVHGRTAVDLSGSGDVRIQGRTERLDVQVIGSGDVDAGDLQAESCGVNIIGSGDVVVHCTGTMDRSISGSGEVHETGNAGRVRGEGVRTY
ncbi:MAG: DUF2807 domain-containing protein [Flavobacteriales bacterium]|nr:DUF2807 domain-containing protein [Flavobacteriales bacterium]